VKSGIFCLPQKRLPSKRLPQKRQQPCDSLKAKTTRPCRSYVARQHHIERIRLLSIRILIFFENIMAAGNTKFATRIGRRRSATRARSDGVRQGRGLVVCNLLFQLSAFLFFKPYRIQTGTRTGHRLRSCSLSVVVSAFARKAVNFPGRALALY